MEPRHNRSSSGTPTGPTPAGRRRLPQWNLIAVFFPVPLDPAAVKNAAAHTRLVCSDDDPYCPEEAAISFGAPLAIPVDLVPNGGHLNHEAGYGPWPAIEAWVRGEAARVTA